jgi:hypothetical protein
MASDRVRPTAAERAEQVWEGLNGSERLGVRFGMFPAEVMKTVESEGYDMKEFAVALMKAGDRRVRRKS